MSRRILHVSDLHLGARKGRDLDAVVEALGALVERVDPALLIASGDLAHRGASADLVAAADLLRGYGRPLLAVPGNHDIPLLPPERFLAPWRGFTGAFGTTEPVHASPDLHVVGVNSVRPLRHQGGAIGAAALERAVDALEQGPPGACRIVVFHHHVLAAPWRVRKRPLSARKAVLERLLGAGAELIVGGHIHQVTASAGREFRTDGARVLLKTAPGLGHPRPSRGGEARGALAYRVEPDAITVETWSFDEVAFELAATRRFPRAPAAARSSAPPELVRSAPG